jgi:hypothetical protein
VIGLEVIVLVRPIENWWPATSSQSVGPMGLKTTNEKRQYLSHVGCYSRVRPADEPLKNGGDGGGSRYDRSVERPSGVKEAREDGKRRGSRGAFKREKVVAWL